MQAVSKRRDDRAGRRCTIGNRVYAKSVSGVRIPISPPDNLSAVSHGAFSYDLLGRTLGGVAEWLNAAVSKTVWPATRVTGVRIPPPPPGYKLQARVTVPALFYDNNRGIRTDEVDSRQENRPVGCFQRIARRL